MPQLTAKSLKPFLQKRENAELKAFLLRFFAQVKSANPARVSTTPEEDKLALDAFARLMTGDEICAAVALSGKDILIATNNHEHGHDCVRYKRTFQVLDKHPGGVTYVLEFTDTLIHEKPKEEPRFIEPKKSGPVIFQFIAADQEFRIIEGNDKIEFSQAEHGIVFPDAGGDVPIGLNLTLKTDLGHFSLLNLCEVKKEMEFFHEPLTLEVGQLRRRASKLILNLAFLAHSIITRPDLETTIRALNEHHDRWPTFLRDSLSFELSTLKPYKAFINTTALADKEKSEGMEMMLDFYRWLVEDYKRFNEAIGQVTSIASIKTWFDDHITPNLTTDGIPAPDFIKASPELFINAARRYFIDLVTMEEFIVRDARRGGRLSTILVEENLFKRIGHIKIVDGLEGLHAEMRLLEKHFQSNSSTRNYFGITRLCCALCTYAIQQFNAVDVRGSHTVLYGGWTLGDFFSQKKYLKIFLGDELFAHFQHLSTIACYFPGEKRIRENRKTLADAALACIDVLKGFNDTETFDMLRIPRALLLPREEESPAASYPDEPAWGPEEKKSAPFFDFEASPHHGQLGGDPTAPWFNFEVD